MTSSKRVPATVGRVPFLAVVVAAIGLMASACGSTSETATPSVASLPEAGESAASADGSSDDSSNAGEGGAAAEDSESPEVSEEEAEAVQLRYEQCLSDRGVDLGGGEVEGGEEEGSITSFELDGDVENFEEALAECDEILEDVFGDFELSPEQEAEFADAEARFNACMADKGFDISGDGAIEIDAEVDFDALDEASADCNVAFEELNETLGEDQ